MGTYTLTQVHLLWKNCTFTSLLWATLLSLLYLNAIQVKSASIYSKHTVYFFLGDERCPFANDSFFWVNSVYRLGQSSLQPSKFVRESVWMISSVPHRTRWVVWSGSRCQGSVTLFWCHSWVLWQSTDTPVMSCFYVSARLRVRSLVCVPCFMLERGVRVPALMSWVSVSCRGSDTRAPRSVLLCEFAVSNSLWPHAHLSMCVLLHAVRAFVGCVHSCYVLCCVARSLCISLVACFHVVMSCVNTWLMNILIRRIRL